MTCHSSWPCLLILTQSLYLAYLHVCNEESMAGHVTTQCVHVGICNKLHGRFNNLRRFSCSMGGLSYRNFVHHV